MDITMVNREVNSRAVNAMAMTAMMLRLRDAHKERRLNFLIHFLFLTFIFIPLARFGAHTKFHAAAVVSPEKQSARLRCG